MSALAALDRASSGQMRAQSSGRMSQRITAPSVAASIGAQYSIGNGRPPEMICERYEVEMPILADSSVLRPRLASSHVSSFMASTIAALNGDRKQCFGTEQPDVEQHFPRPNHDSAMHIGQRIKVLMKARGISTAAMAKHCGVSAGAVSNWFSSGRISKESVVKAAAMLGVSAEDLIEGRVGERGESPPEPREAQNELAVWKRSAQRLAQMAGELEITPAEFLRLVDSMARDSMSQQAREDSTDEQTILIRHLIKLAAKQEH